MAPTTSVVAECVSCLTEFQITIEPGRSESEIRANCEDSLEFIVKYREDPMCPVCASQAILRD